MKHTRNEDKILTEIKIINPSIDWKFLFFWTLATILGLIVGIAISLIVILTISEATNINEDTIAIFILLPSIGFVVGIFQRLVLRRYISWASMWIWVTVAGWVISFPLPLSLYTWLKSTSGIVITEAWEKTIQATLIAIFIGCIQWLLLRRHISGSGWCVLANLIGWNLAGLIAGDGAMVNILDSLLMGISIGAVTGLALTWLLQRPDTMRFETSTS